MLRLASKILLFPSMMALKVVHDNNSSADSLDSLKPLDSIDSSMVEPSYDEATDLKHSIRDLFINKLQTQLEAHRGCDQFAKVKGIYLFQIRSTHWSDPEYWSKYYLSLV